MSEDWREQAACAGADPELWFPEVGCSILDIRAAKRICRTCPVQNDCLEYALDHEVSRWSAFGIWGGLTVHERVPLMNQRQRQRHKNVGAL